MPRVLISASFLTEPLLRQTPGRCGRWEEFEFLTSPKQGTPDAWVVYDDLQEPLECVCCPDNTLLITGEPESLRRYRSRYTGQFAHVWSSHASIHHPSVTRRNEAQPWHYALSGGRVHGCQLGFDELRSLERPQKQRLLSVICSSKSDTEDHRKRQEFVGHLKSAFGDSIDVFGRGIRDMEDKSEAIYDYKYHIVLENDHSDFFMTEKISDAFLGWSYPIYFGGSEAYHRFPQGSFTAIDIYKPADAITIIRNVLASETYEHSLDEIEQARERVLFKNNLCNMLAEYWREYLRPGKSSQIELLPKNHRTRLVLRQFGRVVRNPFAGGTKRLSDAA